MNESLYPSQNYPKFATAAYYLSNFILGFSTALGGPSLPSLAENTASSLDEISLYFALGALGYLLGAIFSGRVYDQISGHKLMSITMAVSAVSLFLIPVVHQLLWLLLLQLALGLVQGVNDVGCNTLLQWLHRDKSGPFMNGMHFIFGLGSAFAPLILAGFLARTGNIQGPFWILTILCLPLIFWFWINPKTPRPQKLNGKKETVPPMLPLVLITLAFTFYVGLELGLGSWLYTYTLKLNLGTVLTAAYLTSAFWGAYTLSRLLGIWISTWIRPQTILMIDILGALASIGLIILQPNSTLILWIGTIGSGLFMASIFPTLLIYSSERLPVTGVITSWQLMGSGSGAMILPWMIGAAFNKLGPTSMPWFLLGSGVLHLISVLLFTGKTANTPPNPDKYGVQDLQNPPRIS